MVDSTYFEFLVHFYRFQIGVKRVQKEFKTDSPKSWKLSFSKKGSKVLRRSPIK